jgi:hypothetical protein
MNRRGVYAAFAAKVAAPQFMSRLSGKRPQHFAVAAFLVSLATVFAAAPASAQLNPAQTVRIIVPFAPAGSSDVLARLLQQPLAEQLKQNVIVENRAGAGANIGTAEVARAAPKRLHAVAGFECAGGQSGAVQERALRSVQGLCADRGAAGSAECVRGEG